MSDKSQYCANGHLLPDNPRFWGCWHCRYNDKRRAEYQYKKLVPLRLFVYGTLKRGHGNNRVLGTTSEWLCDDVLPGARMWTIGYPVVKLEGAGEVKGEVWRVNDASVLRNLDRLEGHPHSYRRTPVVLKSGDMVQTYIWQRETHGMQELPDGLYPLEQRPQRVMA